MKDRAGERNPNSHLNLILVQQIRQGYKPGMRGYKRLAETFLVSPSTIRDIVKGRTWANL